MREKSPLQGPSVMIFAGLYVLWGFGLQTVGQRLWLHVDGVIIASVSLPSDAAPRYSTKYLIVSDDGSTETYFAGATDASLQRGLPVGTKLTKRRWELGYAVNGHWMAFPKLFYFPILAGAGFLLILGVVRYRRVLRSDANR